MRKFFKYLGIVILLLIVALAYQLFHFDNRYFADSTLYEEYSPQNKYQDQYPVSEYVSERMDASAILRSGVLGSMARYDDLVNAQAGLGSKFEILLDVFQSRSTFIKFSQQHQYQEVKPISLEYVGEQENHNFEYTGYLADGSQVTGNLAIWGTTTDVGTAISFQTTDGQISADKAALFTDDSNAEMMAYLMIEAIQAYLGTEYEPEEASLKFFNCSIENVAGSIAYHAAISLYSIDNPVGDLTIEKVKTANISTVDKDGFLVNQSY